MALAHRTNLEEKHVNFSWSKVFFFFFPKKKGSLIRKKIFCRLLSEQNTALNRMITIFVDTHCFDHIIGILQICKTIKNVMLEQQRKNGRLQIIFLFNGES